MVAIASQKVERLNKTANERGVIAAAAMDQRGSLKKAIAQHKGIDKNAVTDDMMHEFKTAVSKVLTPHASAILLDPQWGVPAMQARSDNAGLVVSYEESGYDQTGPGRMPSLLPGWDVPKIIELGGDAVKILMYYTPFEKADVNEKKHAWIRKIGAECDQNDIPFFLECICYDENEQDEKALAFAKRKPDAVEGYMREFSKPEYKVDVLKAEIPVNIAFVEGSIANKTGEVAYGKEEAKDIFRRVAESTKLPFIYLSAGVDDDVFRESLLLAGEAGVRFSGVLCGRATWKEGIPVYAENGVNALEEWLADRGVKNLQALNQVLDKVAKPWWDVYGGKDQVQTN
ncbi:MAG: tagatose 1,6-diphosphate aldolase [Planctomycetes bacterium]|nr:tagatose 1,6-diphosphate aldolase [Planctomycetota bacterium]